MATRKIRVQGIRRETISPEDLALIYWLQTKRILREKREREAQEKAKHRERKP